MIDSGGDDARLRIRVVPSHCNPTPQPTEDYAKRKRWRKGQQPPVGGGGAPGGAAGLGAVAPLGVTSPLGAHRKGGGARG